jgi:Tfp pilus assembly protein PilE
MAKPRWKLRLVELAVVVGVLALLAALTLPAIQSSRETGRRTPGEVDVIPILDSCR